MKNRTMRIATLLLALTLITSCFVGGTFAKYTTTANSSDNARVAKWGFTNTAKINIGDLFLKTYDGTDNTNSTVVSSVDVIAPGTGNFKTFQFTYGGSTEAASPEVDYNFTVSIDGSTCAQVIQDNPNIQWALVKKDANSAINSVADIDTTEWVTWSDLCKEILGLSGDANSTNGETQRTKRYEAGALPEAFENGNDTYVVAWKWDYNGSNMPSGSLSPDEYDTDMGNATALDTVELAISITATQID